MKHLTTRCLLLFLLAVISFEVYGQELIPTVMRNGRFIYVDENGDKAFRKSFDAARSFEGPLAAVKQNDTWGFIDETGQIAIPIDFSNVRDFKTEFTAVELDGKHWFIDKAGNAKDANQYDLIRPAGKYYVVQLNVKYDITNNEGTIIEELLLEDCGGAYDNRITVKKEGRWYSWIDGKFDDDQSQLYFGTLDVTAFPIYSEICEASATPEEINRCSTEQLLRALYMNIKYPNYAREKHIQGTVMVRLVINTDGEPQDVEITQGVEGGLNEEWYAY